MSFENKVVVVTGGAKGIGYAIARRFLDEGARVVIADIDDVAGPRAAAELRSHGDVRFVECDVSERLDVRNMVAATIDEFGDIDVLINNAAIVAQSSFLDLDEAVFDRVLSVNLKGVFLCTQAVARHMVERIAAGASPGCIVNLSSVNAVLVITDQVPYSVSKGGVSQLTKVAALALAPHGIRVNAVGPGSVSTALLDATLADDEARRRILSRTPMQRIAEPKEIAAIVAFLASDDASYLTGQTIYADGGRLPLNYTVPVRE